MGAVEDQVQQLHDVVARLERRIKDLEVRHLGGTASPKSIEEIRMILIGPPGAGRSPAAALGKLGADHAASADRWDKY